MATVSAKRADPPKHLGADRGEVLLEVVLQEILQQYGGDSRAQVWVVAIAVRADDATVPLPASNVLDQLSGCSYGL
jgi:hypothetical protein